jgi:hypothetical protein
LNASRIGLSNLGNAANSGGDVPSCVRDLRLYIHSFSLRTFGLVPYIVNGDMRFYFAIDERCMSRSQMDTLQREFIAILQDQGSISGQDRDVLSGAMPDRGTAPLAHSGHTCTPTKERTFT